MLNSNYIKYLQHFAQTVTMAELHARPEVADLIALRHDVDHDLDAALEMSFWEHCRGFRATYFVLPDAGYWQDARLLDKLLQIQDFGHEIGLHLNALTQWHQGKIADPGQYLGDILDMLRVAGLNVIGVSAHGDRLCYSEQFINYWIFEELRPRDPLATESGLSAEGIPALDDRYRIGYPKEHMLKRGHGSALPLWSVSMRDLGLAYHAVHVPHDRYFTDSGGGWTRSPDPLSEDLSRGRHQVLIHPEYWRGPQKIFFFLSAARSGSKWLATVLDQATPLHAGHEFSLNHRYEGAHLVQDHVTGPGFVSLDKNKDKARLLLLDARTWIEEQGRDYAEANVYLERFLPQLQEVFPDAVLVHLYRNPADVVRSIINRDWYDTPGDDRHPRIDVAGWESMSQFEKACWYVHAVNERLMPLEAKIRFEDMVSKPSALEQSLLYLGIAFYPRLAREYYGRVINANSRQELPRASQWPEALWKLFHHICNPMVDELGYGDRASTPRAPCVQVNPELFNNMLRKPGAHEYNMPVATLDFAGLDSLSGLGHKGCALISRPTGLEIVPDKDVHAHVLLGGGQWGRVVNGAGWAPKPAHYYCGELSVRLYGSGTASLFCLTYSSEGEKAEKKLLLVIKAGQDKYTFSFRVRPNASRFNLAVYMSKDDAPEKLVLSRFELRICAMDGERELHR
jgi:hypothetical protein